MKNLPRCGFIGFILACVLRPACVAQDTLAAAKPARTKQPVAVWFQTRAEWNNFIQTPAESGDSLQYNSKFSPAYLNFNAKGNITGNLSYRIRFNIPKLRRWSDLFDAFDYLALEWHITPNWTVGAGKQMVYLGGYEYDYDPINVYYWSLANNYVPAYEVGISGSYTTNDGNHTIVAQICNSPYNAHSHEFKGLMAYNVLWYGNFGFYKPIWSVNMVNYAPGKFVNFLALGNRFEINPAAVEIDYHNRYFLGQGGYFEDFSLIGKLIVDVKGWANILVKGGVDYNGTGYNDDPWVPSEFSPIRVTEPDREAHISGYIGAGVEIFPLRRLNSKDLRIHACWTADSRSGKFNRHYVTLGVSYWFRAFTRQ